MAKINELYAWKDPGFTEGSVEVPKLSSLATLSSPDWFNQTALSSDFQLNPAKGRLFEELKIKVPYLTAKDWSYLKIVMDFNNPSGAQPFTFYAFVDSVEAESDTADYPLSVVRFHIDLWRTYANNATYGSGTVTHRPRGTDDPIQKVTARFRRVSDRVFPLVPETMIGGGAYWAIINYTREGVENTETESRVIICPVAKTPSTVYYMKLTADGTRYRVPTLEEWILGKYDEIFGIASSSISSVFLSPVAPLKLASGTGTLNDPFVVVGGTSPAPEPVVTTYSGVDSPAPSRLGHYDVTLTDSSTVSRDQWDGVALRTFRGLSESGSGYSNLMTGNVIVDGTTVLSSTGSNDNPGPFLSALSVDDYMRAILGEATFNNLSNGDTVVFSDIYGLYSSGGIDQNLNSVSLGSTVLYTWSWDARVNGGIPTNTTLTYNNGTFGSYWVVVNGVISTSSVTLTTTTPAPTTAEYGFIPSTSQSYVDYAYLYTKTDRFAEYESSLSSAIKTNDTETFVITDLDGSVIATLPWGLSVQEYTFRCVVSATSAYVQFRFNGLNSSVEGLQFSVPLPTLDITSNSWSEYNYSGQRDFDITQRKIARDRALTEGLTGSLSLGAQGAMLGGLKEGSSWLPTARSIGNASLFGALGASAGVAGSLANYMTSGYFNDKIQSATDLLQAGQIDSVITPGSGCDWLFYGRPYQIRSLVPDDYSLARFEADVALNGLSVSEPTASCDTLIRNATGPLTIENLVVRGNIPVEAKQYLKQKFNDGVRLI